MIERYSPPLKSLGTFDAAVTKLLRLATQQAIATPSFPEAGRASLNVRLGDVLPDNDHALANLVRYIGETYLGLTVSPDTTAFVNKVTDAALFAEKSKDQKAASFWHQDFVHSEGGFVQVPNSQVRVILATGQGTENIQGWHSFPEGVQVPRYNNVPTRGERLAALALGDVVYGSDGTLMKSAVDPVGGVRATAAPYEMYLLPPGTVHRTPPEQENGRGFAQMHFPVTPDQHAQLLHDTAYIWVA